MSALGSKMRSVRPFVQPPSNLRPGPSGQPRPPNPWTGWTPWTSNPVLQGLGDPLLQGLGDRYDVAPVRGRPVIALTENEATILVPSGASLTYGGHNKPAPTAGDYSDSPRRTEADGRPAGQGCSHLARPWCSEPEAGGRMSGRPR
jgi:hypothetical protein